MRDRSFHLFLLILAVLLAGLMPCVVSPMPAETFEECMAATETPMKVREVNAIRYELPAQLQYQSKSFSRFKLIRGKMMIIDQRYPLPDDAPPPNTVSIGQYGAGMVPVRSLHACSGYETIDAMKNLFVQLRAAGAEGLYVSCGTVSSAIQRQKLLQHTRALMKTHTPESAVRLAVQACEWPGTGSLLQEYAVEIHTPDGRKPEECEQGQTLLRLCWRHGFVRESSERPFRFRYVGKAHAIAMTYLALDLEQYLEWLHQKECIAVSVGGELQYLILCEPVQNGYAVFELPECSDVELSLDNTGYAIAACTF